MTIRVSLRELRRNNEVAGEFDRQLGRVMQAWAWTSSALIEVFIAITGMPQPLAYRLFDKVRNDRTQREIVLEMGRASLGADHELVKRLAKIVRDIDKCSGQRNTLAHALFSLEVDDGQAEATALDSSQTPDGMHATAYARSVTAKLKLLSSQLIDLVPSLRSASASSRGQTET